MGWGVELIKGGKILEYMLYYLLGVVNEVV